jgi:outer membrane lipoprotein-sorting protein
MRNRTLYVALLLCVGFSSLAAQVLTAEKILQNVKTEFSKVQDYTATLTATIKMERLNIPEMKVKLYFKQPDKMHIESNSFSMLPREGIGLNPSQLLEKYTPTLVETEKNGTDPVYVLQLVPKVKPVRGGKERPLTESKVWIDGKRWVVTRLESAPAEGRKLTVEFEYAVVAGTYLLPSSIVASFDSQQLQADSSAEQRPRQQRMPRKGSVSIHYTDYSVNSGLSDAVFEEKKGDKTK